MNEMQSAEAIWHKQTTYWRNRSAELLRSTSLIKHLSVDHPAPGRRRCRLVLEISDAASANLLRVANGSELAAYILFVTLFKAAAARFTGESLVAVLSPLYRNPTARATTPSRITTDHVLFQDHVDLAGGLKDNGSVTQRTVVGAYSNQDYFPAELAGGGGGLVAQHVVIASGSLHDSTSLAERSPFVIHLARRDSALVADIVIDPDVVDQRLVEQFARHLSIVIDRGSREPSRAFGEIDWLSDVEAAQLARFAQGAVGPIEACPLHELLVKQARKTPSATALIFDGRHVTYAQLDELSDRIARGLVGHGVVPGDFVVVFCTRSVELVAALLAVGKAGAAFVPVEPDLPEARIRSILDRAAPRCVLTNLDRNKVPGVTPVVRVSEARWSRDAIALPASRDIVRAGMAYAIFTSGSTGEPKGVVIEHRGIVNAVSWWTEAHQLAPGHRVLQLFSYSFDGFVLTLFSSLAAGATMVLVKDAEARTASSLVQYIRTHTITHTCVAPALLHGILEEATAADLSSLVRVTVAGDVTRRRTVELCRSLAASVTLSNGYGPTENAVVSTFHPDMDVDAVAVIGKPIGNVEVYILDGALRPVPPGVSGQIALGGPGLARCYLNDPVRTAERFVVWRDQRIYLTGDLGRWRPDGTIEFRGRADDQVKLRGYRIELEDVRRQLLSHDGVTEAVVFVDDSGSSAALVSCFTESKAVDLDALMEHLHARLPDYMVPAEAVRLSDLPLTAAGKYDISEIRARASSERARRRDDVPASDVERRLAAIWSKLLDLDHVGVNKSFFALGGHSLKATRLLARIHAEFGITLPLEAVFRSNTIRKQAALIDAGQQPRSTAIQALGDLTRYPLSPAQQRMLVLAADDALHMSYSVPAVFAIEGELDVVRLEAGIHEVVARHDGLCSFFVWEGSRVTQAIDRACAIAIRRRAIAAGDDLTTALRGLATRFDLSRAPLLAVTLLDAADGGRHLLFEFHHVIVDETSVGIFFRDLEMAYNGIELGPVPSLRYVDYAAWQRERKSTPAYAEKLEYWKRKLASARLGPVALPFEPGAGARETGRGSQHVVHIGERLASSIRDLCAQQELTLFMFFAGAFAAHLHRLTRQDEIVIGSPIIERSRPEAHGVIGLFLNTLLLHHRFDDRIAIDQFLQTVKRDLLLDMANAEAQLEDILNSLPVTRSVDNRSVFNVMVAIIEDAVETLQLGTATARSIDFDNGTAKFDLLLEVRASNGGLRLVFEYSRVRLSASTVDALGRGFVALLERIVAAPATALADLDALDDSEPWLVDRAAGGGTRDEGTVPDHGAPPRRSPGSALEHELVQAWANVLQIAPAGIGVNDSFFMLGGDSLAMSVVAKTVREWGYPIKLRELFANDTIAKLCALLEGMPAGTKAEQETKAGEQRWKQS